MAQLYRNLRVHQIFGANTDVGKTIFTTGLCIASQQLPVADSHGSGEQTFYCKPVQTGPESDWDARHIARFSPSTRATTLHSFPLPLSPHVAALPHLSGGAKAPTDDELVQGAAHWLRSVAGASQAKSVAYVETAGGVHSPAPSGRSISSVLRPLRIPTILIGSAALGGISTTRSAYESLVLAGYDVEAILLFPSQGQLGNVAYLRELMREGTFGEFGAPTKVFGLGGPSGSEGAAWGPPPQRYGSEEEDKQRMQTFYEGLVHGNSEIGQSGEESAGGLLDVIRHLRQRHAERIKELETLAGRSRSQVWWPFTQHVLTKHDKEVLVIDSAHGDHFDTLQNSESGSVLAPTFDGSASWWTQCIGHSNPRLTLAAARAAGRYGHVIFPNASHGPAVRLTERLLGTRAGGQDAISPGKGWADRVFFSDDGSTGMEIALKMAIASARLRYGPEHSASPRVANGRRPGSLGGRPPREWEILGLKGSYHGDTIGAMDACEPSTYSQAVDWYRGRGHWFDPPSVRFKDAKASVRLPEEIGGGTAEYGSIHRVYDVPSRLASDPLAAKYKEFIRRQLDRMVREDGRRFGALVIEPLVLGAGGMVFVDPLYQRVLVDVVRQSSDLFALTDAPLSSAKVNVAEIEDGTTWRGLPVIFDEVFTGLYRLGFSTPAEALGTNPDISCLAKILTGGMMPMSVTLASSAIFESFSRTEKKVDALLHGHSYTAYPIGCEVANETLDILGGMQARNEWGPHKEAWASSEPSKTPLWSTWSPAFVDEISRADRVESVIALGCVLVVELRDSAGAGGYQSTASADVVSHLRSRPENGESFAIHARPLGNVVYLMSSLNSSPSVLRQAENRLREAIVA